MLMALLTPLLTPLGIWSSLAAFGNTLMTPLYWAVSGILVGFHYLWSPLLGDNSGWTWTLSITCLTVIIRVILIPLFVRQIHSSRNLQILAPQLKELQKKHGHDRERLGQETMKLYKETGVNPMASCLPLLLQMPIFFALFRVLAGAATGIAHGQWLVDRPGLLTSLQQATIFGAKISDKFWPPTPFGSVQVLTIILIAAMTVTLFITQMQLMRKNMPPEALTGPMAQQQKIMLYLFPLIFAIGGVNFQVGVLIYWLTSNIWTMGQQFYVIRRNPAPNTPAYAAWEVRQRAKGREVAEPTIKRRTPTAAVGASVVPVDPTRPARQQPRKQTRSQRKT